MGKEQVKTGTNHISEELMEDLLGAWMAMSIGIKGNRILKALSFNEMVICRLLYRAGQEGREITATDLCHETRLLKSQVNKVLSDLEEKGLLYRHRDSADKRRVFLKMTEEKKGIYLKEHRHVMSIIQQVCDRLSKQEIEILVEKMGKVVEVMDEVSV
jgi:DNA-binding MarR family transcriptional regulator